METAQTQHLGEEQTGAGPSVPVQDPALTSALGSRARQRLLGLLMVQPFLDLLSWLAGCHFYTNRLAQPVLKRHFCLMQGPVTSPGKEGMNVSDTALRRGIV